MKFVGNWSQILSKAWSVRLMVVAVFFSALEVGLNSIIALVPAAELPLPAGLFASLAGLLTGAALFARLLVQKNISEGPDK